MAELEEDLGSTNKEEEDKDPRDDADVSDCGHDPNGCNGGGENMEAANIPDEMMDIDCWELAATRFQICTKTTFVLD